MPLVAHQTKKKKSGEFKMSFETVQTETEEGERGSKAFRTTSDGLSFREIGIPVEEKTKELL